jgi:predicted nuclease of predicted toxin-antitoxin system
MDTKSILDEALVNLPPCSFSSEEMQQIRDALWKARCDIWQTARVAEYNLTGKDPSFPSDSADVAPNPPRLIHRAGLDASYAVFEEVSAALKMLHHKMQSTSLRI